MTDKIRVAIAIAASSYLLTTTACVGIGGETISILHDSLPTPEQLASDEISLQTPAADQRADRGRIGRATITVFAITSGNIKTESPVTEAVIGPVEDALKTAGYTVARVPAAEVAGSGTPSLEVSIKKFYFRNYNWVWPIVPTWGGVELGLQLKDARGQVVFDRSVRGSGTSVCLLGNCAFKAATRRAMNGVLADVIDATSGKEFQVALREATATAASLAQSEPSQETPPVSAGPAGEAPTEK